MANYEAFAGFKLFALNREQDASDLDSMARATMQEQQGFMPQPANKPPAPPQFPTQQMPTSGGGGFTPSMGFPPANAPAVEPLGTPRGDEAWQGVRSRILGGAESNGDPNTLYNNANQPGGAFAGVDLTHMTVDQAIAFSDPNGPYAQYVRKLNGGTTATPMGKFQIIGSTLKGLKRDLRLKGDEFMTDALQERMGKHLYQTGGEGQWEGLRNPKSGVGGASQRGYTPKLSSDNSDLDKTDLSQEDYNRDARSAAFMAFGKGLGQISHGQAVDLSDVISDYKNRQMQMRQRLLEITNEKRRRMEHSEDVDRDVSQFDATQEQQRTLQAQAQEYQHGENALTRQGEMEREQYKLAHPDPSDTAKFFSEYQQILKTQGPEAAGKFWEAKVHPSTSIIQNMGDKKDVITYQTNADIGAKRSGELYKQLDDLRAPIAAIDEFKDILGIYGDKLPSGFAQEDFLKLQKAAQTAGVPITSNSEIAVKEALVNLNRRISGAMRAPGQRSDAEQVDEILNNPGIGQSPLGLGFSVHSIDHDVKTFRRYAGEYDKFRAKNPSGGGEGFDEWWQQNVDAGLVPSGIIDTTVSDPQEVEKAAMAFKNGLIDKSSVVVQVNPVTGEKELTFISPEMLEVAKNTAKKMEKDNPNFGKLLPKPWEINP